MKNCTIIIPIYKPYTLLSEFESASLNQIVKVMSDWNLTIICPQDMEVNDYMTIHEFNVIRFENKHFESVRTYNALCQSPDFYKAFDTDYILLYQLDAWIFEDNLQYFLDKGYDYIGAPHEDYIHKDLVVGNGGFSLRKVATFIHVCETTDFSKCRQTWEDIVFTNDCADQLNIADIDTAYEFAWQQLPARHMTRLGKLPMGCHSLQKYSDWAFWNQYINLNSEE